MKIGVFVCHCGSNIEATVDTATVAKIALTYPDVVFSEDTMYTCSEPGQENIVQAIKTHGLDGVVVASCSPRMHEPTFRRTVERAGLNRKIEQLKDRLCSNALVQEGEKPVENPETLKRELDESVSRLTWLMARINLTNCRTMADGMTLTELIAKKDALLVKLHAYRDVVYAGSQTAYRARNTEIRIQSAVSVPAWQAEVDRMAKEVRELDNRLQQSNWTTDLTE